VQGLVGHQHRLALEVHLNMGVIAPFPPSYAANG
jgi:hypothetical protein